MDLCVRRPCGTNRDTGARMLCGPYCFDENSHKAQLKFMTLCGSVGASKDIQEVGNSMHGPNRGLKQG